MQVEVYNQMNAATSSCGQLGFPAFPTLIKKMLSISAASMCINLRPSQGISPAVLRVLKARTETLYAAEDTELIHASKPEQRHLPTYSASD